MSERIIRPDEYYNTVHVEDYYDKIHRTTWVRRTSGLFSGATLGIVYGGLVGVAIAYLPYALAAFHVAGIAAVAFPTLLAVGATAALVASAGAFLAIAISTDVSANSAAVAAGFEEFEKRHKVERLKDGAAVTRDTGPVTKGDEPASVHMPRIPMYSWRVALVTTTICAIFGALIACNPITFSGMALLGLAPHTIAAASTAACILSATAFGSLGAILGFKNSLISNKLTNFYFKVLSEQYFHHDSQKHVAENLTPLHTAKDGPCAVEMPPQEMPKPMEGRTAAPFADREKRFSLAELISRDTQDTNVANSLQR